MAGRKEKGQDFLSFGSEKGQAFASLGVEKEKGS